MLKFPDGTRVRVNCLDEILTELYSEGRQPNSETAEEILDRLEKHNNYIPASARREYKSVLLKEYRDYVAERKNEVP
jgi:HEPN domain-containing protein